MLGQRQNPLFQTAQPFTLGSPQNFFHPPNQTVDFSSSTKKYLSDARFVPLVIMTVISTLLTILISIASFTPKKNLDKKMFFRNIFDHGGVIAVQNIMLSSALLIFLYVYCFEKSAASKLFCLIFFIIFFGLHMVLVLLMIAMKIYLE